jgi:hypothetical protein
MRRFALAVVLVLVLVPVSAAAGSGPPQGAQLSGTGIVAGALRYVALQGGTNISGPSTLVAQIRTADGAVARSVALEGRYGFARLGYQGGSEGLSADRSTLVLEETPYTRQGSAISSFVAFDASRLRLKQRIDLRGDFSYDALSPDGRYLFLIQHVPSADASHYVVRAYDRATSRLLPGRIADRTQRTWVMSGFAVSRATSGDGRWVYTLYQNPGGFPFVHALDTVTRTAHCVGFPFSGDQAALASMRLALRDGERTLALNSRSGERYVAIDTRTWKLSWPDGGFPWWIVGAALGGVATLVAAGAVVRSRRGHRQQPGDVATAC